MLSRKALINFVEKSVATCRQTDTWEEDVEMGNSCLFKVLSSQINQPFLSFLGLCLANHAISVDCRDEQKAKRFYPSNIEHHLRTNIDMNNWYYKYLYYDVVQGNLGCCSDTIAQIHYVKPHEMYMFEYLTYRVHPFGLEKNLTETLPQKMPMKEILRRSHDPNASSNRKRYEEEMRKEKAEAELKKKAQNTKKN